MPVAMRMLLCWLGAACLLLLAGTPGAWAGGVVLQEGVNSYTLHERVDYLEDADGRLTLDEVRSPEFDARFTGSGGGLFSFGYTDSVYWFRFTIDNPAAWNRHMLLVLRTPWLGDVRLYAPDGHGGFGERRVGDRLPFAERERVHPQFILDLDVAPGARTYYLRIATKQAFMSPMELWEPQAFADEDRLWAIYFGVLYGVILVMLLYNGFIWFSIRDASYLYYCLYLGAFFMANFSYNGFSFQYLWPESPEWINWSYATWILLFQFIFLLFAMHFLETRTRTPRMHKVLQGYLLLMSLTWAGSLLSGDEVFYNAMAVYFVFPYAPLAAVASILSWRAGYRAARFFIVASMTAVVGAFVSALTVSGLLPYGFVAFHAVEFGVTADVVLLALALADRINFLREQKERAEAEVLLEQERANVMLQKARDELEKTVSARTAELALARDQAERLARTDTLTGVSNRRYFEEIGAREFARARRYMQPLSIILFDLDSFKSVNDVYGHAAGDAVIRMAADLAREVVREVDFVARLGGEEFVILLAGVTVEQAIVTAERLRVQLGGRAVDYQGQQIRITASFGVAELDAGDERIESVLRRADEVMYMSKRAGKDRVSH